MITHVENLGTNKTNCSSVIFLLDDHYRYVEIILLACLLLFIITVNLLLTVIILSTDSLRGCALCLQLTASFLGNVVGGVSLIGSDIYYTKFGITPFGCHRGIDGHTLLYFGIIMNLTMLMMNTRLRYLTAIKLHNDNNTIQQWRILKFILKCWVPAFIISLGLALAASVIEHLVTANYNFLISVGLSFPPIIIVIAWNILLGRFLKRSKRNSAVMQQKSSLRVIKEATFIIKATLTAHVTFLCIGCITNFMVTFYMKMFQVVIAMNWLLRLSYVSLFTVEAIVYMYKGTMIRTLIGQKMTYIRYSLLGGKKDPL